MYGFEEYIELTPEHILQKVSQEQIFKIVFKQEVETDLVCYRSPLRKDKNPGCWFKYYDGTLLFIDFGDKKRTHRSCFRMIMDKYGVDMRSAINIICNYYNLSSNPLDYKEVELEDYEYSSPTKTPLIINFTKREFTKQDKKYWSQYLIYPSQLEEDNVYSVESFSFSTGKTIKPFGLCYAYTFPNDRVKIYQPLTNPKYKWITNCNNNVVGNIHNISDKGDLLIVSKSYKDSRVLRNLGIKDVVWFQNEGQVPNDEINIDLINRFKEIVFFYDNDIAGIEAGNKLSNIYNSYKSNCSRAVHLPKMCKWKDPSDFIRREGRVDLMKILKRMKLYGKDT